MDSKEYAGSLKNHLNGSKLRLRKNTAILYCAGQKNMTAQDSIESAIPYFSLV